MASYRRAVATRNLVADYEGDALNSGSIQLRSSAQPTNVDDAAVGTLLATLLYAATAFGAPSSGVATAAAITSDTNVDNSGTVDHARQLDSGAAIHSDADCGTATESFVFDNDVFVAGGTAAASSLTLTAAI